MKDFMIDERYTNLKVIGEGSYGVVAKGIDSVTGQKIAVKKVRHAFADVVDAKRILRELKLLRHLNSHENIIHILDVMVYPPDERQMKDIYIVTNLMDSDLQKIIDTEQAFTDKHLQFFIYQILRGLKYIHSANVLHRDLKPSNVLVNGNCEIALCDFGLSRGFDDEEYNLFTQYVATRWYRAPELLCDCGSYGRPVDIWSVGCLFAELITKRPLFPGRDPQHQLEVIIKKVGCPPRSELQKLIVNPTALASVEACARALKPSNFAEYFPDHTNPSALDLMRRMLEFDPKERITVEEALEHPFLRGFHRQFQEPSSDTVFDYNFEKKENGISSMSEDEVRACMFEEACYYRSYGSGEEKTHRIERESGKEGKEGHGQITTWRRNNEKREEGKSESK